jgi:DNA topoisomerase-3
MAKSLVDGLVLAFGVRVINNFRDDGFYAMSNGDAVAPLLGHLLEMEFLKPEHRQARLGTYFDFLPVKIDRPKYRPRPDTDRAGKPRLDKDRNPIPPRAFTVVQRLLKSCKEVVNAGDIDREGQRIVDELLEYVGIDPSGSTKPVWRLPLVSNRPEDIAKLVHQLEQNGDPKWSLRGAEALVRQILDAATGLNGSMALQEITGRPNMSVGRVQTPVLWIVYERDQAVENFKPHDYFVPVIMLSDGTEMRWHKREGCQGLPGFDREGRITDRDLAQAIVDRIARGLRGTITLSDAKRAKVAPPLPFTSASLASTAAQRFGMTPKEAERAAQSLYEHHKAITYVGTDCQYLPTSMLEDARATLQALSRIMPAKAGGADLSLRSAAWNDAKVDEHFAIVPTGKLPASASPEEAAVFETVCKRYIAQFYPAHEYIKHSLWALFEQDEFRASRREVVRQGWREVESDAELGGKDLSGQGDDDQDGDHEGAAARDRGPHSPRGRREEELA